MQSANATLLSRVILCFRKYPLSKCREQMLYYLLELVYALDNPLYPNAKYKCVIYCGHLMLEKIPSFQMQSTNVTLFTVVIIYLREFPLSTMQCSNATLCTGNLLCFREYTNTHLSKCKVQMRYYLLGLKYALENTPFPNAKYKCDIICLDCVCLKEYPSSFQMQSTNATLLIGFTFML